MSDGESTQWEGYSNYQEVSKSMAESVADAMDSYAWIQGAHLNGAPVNAADAAHVHADILGAAMKLRVEMREEQERGNEDYDEILARWDGEDDGSGFIRMLHEHELANELPGWMLQFVDDIRTAAWRLGYLQAGRRREELPDDPVERDAKKMYQGV